MEKKVQFFAVLLLSMAISVNSSLQPIQIIRGQVRARPLPQKQLHEVEETIRLVTEGEAAIEKEIERLQVRDFVLVVGNTGAGKSTITKFLTQPEKLESYDVGDRFLIRDINQTNGGRESTIISKTLLPELFIDPETSTAFFDMPGFSDTRNASVEVANSWFMKKVADGAARVKILFIVNYSSLRRGQDRLAFKNMIDHVTNYIKFSKKFARSIALIATKVDVDAEKEVIHSVIGDFLEQALENLEEVFQDPVKIQRATDLLNNLLVESGTGLARVSYFTQPKSAAPLTSFPNLMRIRQGIRTFIGRMKWAPVSAEDFGVSLSSNALLLVQRSEYLINSHVATAISAIAEKVGESFQCQVRRHPHPSFVGSSLLLQETFLNLTSDMKGASTRSEFLSGLRNITDAFSVPNVTLHYDEIGKMEENLEFFKKISSGNSFRFPIQDWSRILTHTESTIRSTVGRVATAFNGEVERQLTNFSSNLQASVFSHVNQSRSPNETAEIFQAYSQVLESYLQDLAASPTYNSFLTRVMELASATSVPVPEQMRISADVSLLQNYGDEPSPFALSRWIRPLESLTTLLKERVTAAGLSLREQRHNQTIQVLQQNQTQVEQQMEQKLQALRLEISELEANATRELEESQLQMVRLKEQQQINATLERDLIERQLEELQQARERNFTETLLEANRTLTAQQALLTQRLKNMELEIQAEKEKGLEIERASAARRRQDQDRLLELKAQLTAVRGADPKRKGKATEPGTETQGSAVDVRSTNRTNTVTKPWAATRSPPSRSLVERQEQQSRREQRRQQQASRRLTPGTAQPGRERESHSQQGGDGSPQPQTTSTPRQQKGRQAVVQPGETGEAASLDINETVLATVNTPTLLLTLTPYSLSQEEEEEQEFSGPEEEEEVGLAGAAQLPQNGGRLLQHEAPEPRPSTTPEPQRNLPSLSLEHTRHGVREVNDETLMSTFTTPITLQPTLHPLGPIIKDEEEQQQELQSQKNQEEMDARAAKLLRLKERLSRRKAHLRRTETTTPETQIEVEAEEEENEHGPEFTVMNV